MYTPVYVGLTGSRLYGTHRPDSDHDYRGVVLGTRDSYLGMLKTFEHTNNLNLIEWAGQTRELYRALDGQDVEFYEIGKFMKLAWDCNPNIVELLFSPNLWPTNDIWIRILTHRHMFISKKCLHTFSGYAASQLKRLKNHRIWVNGMEKPCREAMGLPTTNKVLSSDLLKHLATVSNSDLEFLCPNEGQRELIRAELRYQEQKRQWRSYQTWLKERNPARARFERLYGYDVKHCAHLVRLFYECKRLLETGELVFPLPEAEELKRVLAGDWTYEQVMEFGESIDERLKAIADRSTLPQSPDRKKLDQLVQEFRSEVICG